MVAVILVSILFALILMGTIYECFEKNAYGDKKFPPAQRALAVLVLIIWTTFSAWCTIHIRQSIIDSAIDAYRNDQVTIVEKNVDDVTVERSYRLQ